MGTIIARKRKDGSTGYHAQVTIKRGGEIVHRETRTFDRRQAASAWMEKRETELAKPGALERQNMPDPKLSTVIDGYIKELIKDIGRTKAQVLATIKEYDIADLKCSEVTSEQLVPSPRNCRFNPNGRKLLQPPRLNLHHCTASLGLSVKLTSDGRRTGRDQKPRTHSKSKERDRRPTLAELDLLMHHFRKIKIHRPRSAPMQQIIVFAISVLGGRKNHANRMDGF